MAEKSSMNRPLSIRARLLDSTNGSKFTSSMTSKMNTGSGRVHPGVDTVEPRQTELLTRRLEPMCKKSRTESKKSNLLEERTNKNNSRWVPSMTDSKDTKPARLNPNGEAIEPT